MILPQFCQRYARKQRQLSLLLDLILWGSFGCLLYVLVGGSIRWKTSLFSLTIENLSGPIKFFILALIMKITFLFYEKIFAYVSKNRINIVCSVISILFCLICLELYFRYFTYTLPYDLGNHIASGYNNNISGIYRYNSDMKMLLMRPNHQRTMFFQGYSWNHQTDEIGFRNPVTYTSADVVLLGDSMIYGHGVEETSTIRHHLESITGKPVVNFGIQGASIHQEYQILKNFGINLNPRYVFLFFLVNDIRDLVIYLTDEEMQRFLMIPVEDHVSPYFNISNNLKESYNVFSYINDLYIIRAFDFFIKLMSYMISNVYAMEHTWQSLPLFQENPRLLLSMKFHLHALLKIHHLSKINHFHFMNIFIYTGHTFPTYHPHEEKIYENILKEYCHTYGIPFYSLKDDVKLALNDGEEVFLPYDGHFSDSGAYLVAQALSQLIRPEAGSIERGGDGVEPRESH